MIACLISFHMWLLQTVLLLLEKQLLPVQEGMKDSRSCDTDDIVNGKLSVLQLLRYNFDLTLFE